jgi:hypothetical protein
MDSLANTGISPRIVSCPPLKSIAITHSPATIFKPIRKQDNSSPSVLVLPENSPVEVGILAFI